MGIIEFVCGHFPFMNLLGFILLRWFFCHRACLLPAIMVRIRRISSGFTSSCHYRLNVLHSRGHGGSHLSKLSFNHLVDTQLVLNGSGEAIYLGMDGLQGFALAANFF